MTKKKMKKSAKQAKKAEIVKAAQVTMSRPEAQKIQAGIIEDLRSADQSLVSAALKLGRLVEGQGWRALGYKNMTDWREKEVPFSDFYNLRNVQRLLSAGVSAERIERMRLTNINTMVRQLPESKWKEESWQTAAEKLPVEKFAAQARETSEKIGMHVEELARRGFSLSASLAEKFDKALKVAEAIEGATTMEMRVEAIVANYLTSPSPMPWMNKLQYYEEKVAPEGAREVAAAAF